MALIDDFYWEHHVNFQPMVKYWATGRSARTMNDSIAMFAGLREAGVRAHSWT